MELLFIWARSELDEYLGNAEAERVAGHRRAIEALEKIESCHPHIPAVSLWMADCWDAIGDQQASAAARAGPSRYVRSARQAITCSVNTMLGTADGTRPWQAIGKRSIGSPTITSPSWPRACCWANSRSTNPPKLCSRARSPRIQAA